MNEVFTADTAARIAVETGEPAWLAERRRDAFARFEAASWPDQSVEQWRHTDIRALDPGRFVPAAAELSLESSPDLAARGVIVESMARAAVDHAELLQAWLGRAGVSDFEAKLAAFNAAFSAGGLFIYVPPGVEVAEPLVARHRINTAGEATFPRTVLVADEGSLVTFVDRYECGELGGEALSVASVEIYAEQAAQVNCLAVQDWAQTVWHFGVYRALIGRDATVRSLAATLGGRLSRSVVEAVLEGRGAHAELLGVYFGDHDQHIDNRTLQLHRGPNTSSELYYKGALKGNARAIYSGLVDIEKDAIMSDAQQANRNLLLSDGASADPSPFLEIKTSEVVRATHGVSVGRPDENVLFYLRSRGLDRDAATNLFVKGFFQEVIDRVRVPEIREALEGAVEAELALEE